MTCTCGHDAAWHQPGCIACGCGAWTGREHGIVSDPSTGLWTKRAHSTGRFAHLRQSRDAFKGVRREN